MKRILFNIILLSFSVVLLGQLPQTNLNFRWVSGYTEVTGKYYLIDSLIGVYNTDLEVIKVNSSQLSNISSGYIDTKDSTEIVLFETDTLPITCLFWNYNYEDTLYFEMLEHTINSDSTENLPYRLNSIAHYSIPTDSRSYFSGIEITGTMIEVTTTINAAIASAAANDTIYVKTGVYIEDDATYHNLTIDKNIVLLGIGDVNVKASAGANSVVTSVTSTGANKGIYNIYLDAEGAYARCVYNLTRLTVKNCYLNNPTNLHVQISNTTDTLSNCVFVGGGSTAVIYGSDYYMSECYVNGVASQMLYTNSGNDVRYLFYNKFIINHAFTYIERNANSIDYVTKYNEYILNVATTNGIVFTNTTSGNINFSGNLFIINYASTLSIIYHAPNVNYAATYNYNIFNYNSQGIGRSFLINDESSINISNNEFYSENTTQYTYVDYYNTTATLQTGLEISNNIFRVANRLGYGIKVGIETTSVADNTISPAIDGNIINNVDTTSNFFHSIFVGFQNNPTIQYNFVDSAGYGAVIKATTGNYTNENISYNIFNKCVVGYRIKGVSGVNTYNNTINGCKYAYYISNNDGSGSGLNQVIINNILSNNSDHIFISSGGSVSVSNYNLLYNGSIDNNSFSVWQGLGYDLNSFNTNPHFKSPTQLWPVPNSNAVGNGYNLGYPYNVGLDIATAWPDNIVTKNQLSAWSMGAYVVPLSNRSVTTGKKVILYNGKLITFNK